MEDERIIDLYWDRNQTAIDETAVKYGSFLHRFLNQIRLKTYIKPQTWP